MALFKNSRNCLLYRLLHRSTVSPPPFPGCSSRIRHLVGPRRGCSGLAGHFTLRTLLALGTVTVTAINCFRYLETVPYTNRTRVLLFPPDDERRRGLAEFAEFKNAHEILPAFHPESLRVRRISSDIVGAALRGLTGRPVAPDVLAYGNVSTDGAEDKTEDYWKAMLRIMKWLLMKPGWGKPDTAHLDGLNWEVIVFRGKDLDEGAASFPGGKLAVSAPPFPH